MGQDESEESQGTSQDAARGENDQKKRFRRKSPRRQLEESLRQIDRLLGSKTMKEAKSADLLIEKIGVRRSGDFRIQSPQLRFTDASGWTRNRARLSARCRET